MLSQTRLLELLYYEPITGEFTWVNSTRKGWMGKAAGTPVGSYISIGVDGRYYRAHHLAVVYMTGEWPNEVDHRNGVGSDNSWLNLRVATRSINCRNRVTKNSTGIVGVSWYSKRSKWVTQITTLDRVRIRLYFDSLLDACAYRKSEELKHEYTERHGVAQCSLLK